MNQLKSAAKSITRLGLMRRVVLVTALAAPLGLTPVRGQSARDLSDTVAYTTTTLNLREKPFLTARVLAILAPGTPVRTYTCAEGWCSVTVPVNRLAGYVSAQFLTLVRPAVLPQGRGYFNSKGVWVPSPQRTPGNKAPEGATARCRDGTYSFSQSRRGTCSHHGGVAEWLSH